MNAKILFGLSLACFVIVAEVSGRSCLACGFGEGADYCKECSTYLVRPLPVPKPRASCGKVFRPVGDACACGNIKVHPVPLPKPKYIAKEKKVMVCDSRPLVPAPACLHDFSQEEQEYLMDSTVIQENTPCGNQKPMFPVDAVSIDLVNRMQQSAAMTIPEEKLQYGFWKLPKDMPAYKQIHNIPEEKLFTVDRQIVELKHPRTLVSCGTGADDEVLLDDKEPQPIAYLSYRDLGYVPEPNSGHKFISNCRDRNPVKAAQYDDGYVVSRGAEQSRVGGSSGCGC